MSVFVLLFFIPIVFCADDPCATYADLPRASYRGGQCAYTNGKEVCDSTLPTKWYRAQALNKDLEIQTTPAVFGKCGTKFPFWMNGTHPTVENQEVNRTVCMTDITDCDSVMHIKVKNCGGFYVYKLTPTSGCNKGYCFGVNELCPPFDPCDVYEHTAVDSDPGRSAVCGGVLGTCDNFNGDTWYKFQTETSNLNVSSACPSVQNACGAPLSLWINDTVALNNGTYKHTACVKNGTNCCSSTRTVLSKPCKTFSVYNFGNQPMDNCQRVCTDITGVQCPTLPTSPSTTTATTSKININESTTGCSNQQSVNKRVFPDEEGQQSVTKHVCPHDNGSTNYLWVIGVAVGILVGIVIGVVVVTKLAKNRGKRVSDSSLFEKPSSRLYPGSTT